MRKKSYQVATDKRRGSVYFNGEKAFMVTKQLGKGGFNIGRKMETADERSAVVVLSPLGCVLVRMSLNPMKYRAEELQNFLRQPAYVLHGRNLYFVDYNFGVKRLFYANQELGKLNKIFDKEANKIISASNENLREITAITRPNHAFKQYIFWDELNAKIEFFRDRYPDADVELFQEGNSVRAIVPFISGVAFHVEVNGPKDQFKRFLSGVLELEKCHEKRFMLDIKGDNLLFNSDTEESRSIDGGYSVRKGQVVPATFFACDDQNDIENQKKSLAHLAPECWYLRGSCPPLARESMDVYGFGFMMEDIILSDDFQDETLLKLAQECQRKDPQERPTLSCLKTFLHIYKFILEFPSNFDEKHNEMGIIYYKKLLREKLVKIKHPDELPTQLQIYLDERILEKTREITKNAKQRMVEIGLNSLRNKLDIFKKEMLVEVKASPSVYLLVNNLVSDLQDHIAEYELNHHLDVFRVKVRKTFAESKVLQEICLEELMVLQMAFDRFDPSGNTAEKLAYSARQRFYTPQENSKVHAGVSVSFRMD